MSPRFETIGRRLTGGDALPGWFSAGLYFVIVWCAAAGVTALFLLTKNVYSPVWCVLIATVLTAAAFPFRPRRPVGEKGAHGPAAVAVAIAAVLLVFVGVSHSEHLLADRDPVVYINTGRSIARTQSVHPRIAQSPFGDQATFTLRTSGFVVAGHKLFSNFLNFLPVLLALGWSAGGDTGLLLVPALLGALGMLALYALASTVVGPRWALLAPALLTLAPLQMWFARDVYAELPVVLLGLGGLWLFIDARRRSSPTAGAIAGILLGSITFARIDALGIMIAIPAALAVEFIWTESLERRERRLRRATISSFAIAGGATIWLGLRVSWRLSPGYLVNLHDELHQLELGFFVGLAGVVGILLVHGVRGGVGHRIAHSKIVLGAAAAVVVGVAAYAFHWRPRTGVPPSLKDGVPRTTLNAFFFSSSFRWFGWYLGVFALGFIVAGFIVLGIRAARADSPAFIVLAAAGPMTVFYIARPSISPDQLWAMRRFLPIVLPGMAIAAAAAALWSTAAIGALVAARLGAPFAVVVIAAILVPAARAGGPLLGAQMQGGALDAVHEICRTAGPNGAVAIEPFGLLSLELQQSVRGFCGIPTAGIRKEQTGPLGAYAAAWKAQGRQLFVATAHETSPLATTANAVEVAHAVIADRREPERVLGRPTRTYLPRPMQVWLYRIDPA